LHDINLQLRVIKWELHDIYGHCCVINSELSDIKSELWDIKSELCYKFKIE